MGTYGQGSTRPLRRARAIVLARDGYQCQIRGPHCTGHATIADHITNLAALGIPRTDPAAADPDAMQAACSPCHDAKTALERRRGIETARERKKAPRRKRGALKQHPGD